jgi:hypothetical protein
MLRIWRYQTWSVGARRACWCRRQQQGDIEHLQQFAKSGWLFYFCRKLFGKGLEKFLATSKKLLLHANTRVRIILSLLYIYIRNLLYSLILFHPPTLASSTGETRMPNGVCACIFAPWRQVFPKLQKIVKSFAKLLEGVFLAFLPKINNADPV